MTPVVQLTGFAPGEVSGILLAFLETVYRGEWDHDGKGQMTLTVNHFRFMTAVSAALGLGDLPPDTDFDALADDEADFTRRLKDVSRRVADAGALLAGAAMQDRTDAFGEGR